MAGWNLKNGELNNAYLTDNEYWALFNFVFSESSMKRNTYKFGLVKSILDSLFSGVEKKEGIFLSYENLFSRFAENYWNLVIKYNLKQMRRDGKSEYSRIESIFKLAVKENCIIGGFEFDSLDETTKKRIIKEVIKGCKGNVVGALYKDFDGCVYSFDIKGKGITISFAAYEFMLRHKYEIEKLNYYSWAKFLEKVNADNVLVKVLGKLESSTPHREDLSIYREILREEFEENTCFYCGKKLFRNVHVDHFIPWSFVKDDKLWNFVLACSKCNERKSNRLPTKDYLEKLEKRNSIDVATSNIDIIRIDFSDYSDGLINRMWTYAKACGLKEFRV